MFQTLASAISKSKAVSESTEATAKTAGQKQQSSHDSSSEACHDATATNVTYKVINPKAMTLGELYGAYEPFSQEWHDGECGWMVSGMMVGCMMVSCMMVSGIMASGMMVSVA